MIHLENPVLSLAFDAVSKVEGQDAICGLLTLLTKCKEGLQEGVRAENLAMRLWHRERLSGSTFTSPRLCASPDLLASPITSDDDSSSSAGESDCSSDSEEWEHHHPQSATDHPQITNPSSPPISSSVSPNRRSHSAAPHHQHAKPQKPLERSLSAHSTISAKSSERRPSLTSRRSHSNTSCGKIMAELLPEKLDVRAATKKPTPLSSELAEMADVPSVVVMTLPESGALVLPPAEGEMAAPGGQVIGRFTVVIQNPTPYSTRPCSPVSSLRKDSLLVPSLSSSRPTAAGSAIAPSAPEAASSKPKQSLPGSPTDGVVTRMEGDNAVGRPCDGAEPRVLSGASGVVGERSRPSLSSTETSIASAAQPAQAALSSQVQPQRPPVFAPAGAMLSAATASPAEQESVRGGGKFFLARLSGSQDGDSQSGSSPRSSVNENVHATTNTNTSTNPNMGEPASVVSTTSQAKSVRSHSSSGSGKMKLTKGKGKAGASGVSPHSHGRGSSHPGAGMKEEVLGGTVFRTKVGGRVGAAQAQSAAMQNNARLAKAAAAGGTARPAQVKRGDSRSRAANRSASRGRRASDSSQANRLAAMQAKGAMPVVGSPLAATKPAVAGPVAPAPAPAPARADAGPSAPAPALSASVAGKARLEMANSDSDFETTDDDDWSTDAEELEETDREEREARQRAQEQQQKQAAAVARAREQARAREEERQREMFSKVPRQSYTNLQRTQSARGLLSTMFHPPPEFFPENHPYRRSMSTHDILAQPPRAFVPLAGAGAAAARGAGKSAAAGPVANAVNAAGAATGGSPSQTRRSPLRLRGRQADVDMEESGDEEEQGNGLHVSTSVAEQKLAELHRRSANRRASANANANEGQPQPQRHRARFDVPPEAGPSRQQQQQQQQRSSAAAARASVLPMPITTYFPYYLPEPMAPTTPRTTRRNFLAHELSESLRRNMLWERQISRQRPLRRTITVADGIGNTNANANAGGQDAQQQEQQPQQPLDPEAQRLEERRRAAIARNKSWAGDFHYDGW